MNSLYPINSVDKSFNVSFNGLFSRKKNEVAPYILPYGKTSIMNGEARVGIPEDSVIRLRDTYDIDLTTKEMKKKIKKLKKNDSIIIGRADINPDDLSISRKQFELRKIDKVLYVYNLSQNGTEIQVFNPNAQTQISDVPKPVNARRTQNNSFVNLDPKYLRARYGQPNLDFTQLVEMKYNELRVGNYSLESTFGRDIEHSIQRVQQAVDTVPARGSINPLNCWNYRHFQYGFLPNIVERISLNVKADPGLIRELDELFITGRYTDMKGNRCQVPENKRVPGYYKTYGNVKRWTYRHDPITMYFAKEVTPEMTNAISDISQRYARPSSNGMPLVRALPGKPWIAKEQEPREEMLPPILAKAEKLSPQLKQAILGLCYEHWNDQTGYSDFIISAGYFEALKIVTDEYDAYLRLPRR